MSFSKDEFHRRFTTTVMISSLMFLSSANISAANSVGDSWLHLAKETKKILASCPKNNTTVLFSCMKSGSLQLFDRISSADIIPLTQHVRFKRYRYNENDKNIQTIENRNFFMKRREIDLNQSRDRTWTNYVIDKFFNILSTHSIQIDFGEYTKDQARHRRRRNQMLPMMIFGMTALGMVLVPLGFQFLAVLGGKALLLAKMALLLASINGIKKVATSGVHYGFYHTDPHMHHPLYERSDLHPRYHQ